MQTQTCTLLVLVYIRKIKLTTDVGSFWSGYTKTKGQPNLKLKRPRRVGMK